MKTSGSVDTYEYLLRFKARDHLFCCTLSETQISKSNLRLHANLAQRALHLITYSRCLSVGQGALGYGRVNALRAWHVASLSLTLPVYIAGFGIPATTELISERGDVAGVTARK